MTIATRIAAAKAKLPNMDLDFRIGQVRVFEQRYGLILAIEFLVAHDRMAGIDELLSITEQWRDYSGAHTIPLPPITFHVG